MSENKGYVLSISHLSKKLSGKQILSDISLDLNPGEIFGFLGPNGSGKTTTIKLILGLLNIEDGEISVCGYNLKKDFEKAMAEVGGIIENPEMYKYLSAKENLRQYQRMNGKVDDNRIDEVLELVKLKGREKEKIGKYSLGMRQRLGLAQALIHKPKLLVLDEPTNGLDPEGIHDLRTILKKISHENGVAVFVSSHMLAELELMCDRVGIVDKGKLLTIKYIDELKENITDQSEVVLTDIELHPVNPEDANKLCDIMLSKGYKSQNDNGIIIVSVPQENVFDIIKTAVSENIAINAVIPKKRSLEDAFLEITKKSDGTL